ncbi:hypothetical protein GQR58_004435 [Nymphon striatum]|nr:hypothetical protein GQR58_004435 [Nymphon striatum]
MMDEPEIVQAVHEDYINAGAQVLTLNSYSATPERLARDASEELKLKQQHLRQKKVASLSWCALSLDDNDGMKLRSGESVEAGIEAAKKAGADAILFNCSLPEVISVAMPTLSKCGLPFGAYANGFTKADDLELGGTVDVLTARTDLGPKEYADFCSLMPVPSHRITNISEGDQEGWEVYLKAVDMIRSGEDVLDAFYRRS